MQHDELVNLLINDSTIKKSISSILEESFKIIENSVSNELYIKGREEGVVSVLRQIINIYGLVDNEHIKKQLKTILDVYGVIELISTGDTLNANNNSLYRIMDVINDPENPNNVISISPGYYMKDSHGENIVLQYESIKINEAHYNEPLELFKMNNNND